MKHRNSHLLVGYWSRLRRGRAIPDQTDIDPRAIKRMLASVFILDCVDPDRPSYRLAGTTICDRFGFELKGSGFLGQWESQSRNAVTSLLRQSLATSQPVCISAIGTTSDCAMVETETVLAPLTFGSASAARFLGMTQLLGDSGALNGKPIVFQRLVGSKIIQEDEPLSSYIPPPPPLPPADAIRSHPKAPHLRLIVSRTKPAIVHRDMDEMLLKMIEALEIVRLPQLSVLT